MFRKLSGLLIVGFALTLSVSQAWADGTPTPAALHMESTPEIKHGHEEGTPAADHEADHGERIPAGDASIRIVSPADRAVLEDSTVIVKVETTNWPLGDGKHWHLFVNGQEQGMSQGSSPSLQAHDLMAGANVLEAVMSNELHQELDAVAKVIVQVEQARMGATGNVLPIVIGFAAAVMAIGGAALLLLRKK
jgi:hypothetical protein